MTQAQAQAQHRLLLACSWDLQAAQTLPPGIAVWADMLQASVRGHSISYVAWLYWTRLMQNPTCEGMNRPHQSTRT